MSVKELINRLQAMPSGAPLDVTEIREEIVEAYKNANQESEETMLLQLHKVVMDNAERFLSADVLDQFRITRRQDYNFLLISKCLDGENVSPDLLHAVTQREVAAGRMTPDDELCQLAAAGKEILGSSQKQLSSKGIVQRILARLWFRK